MARCLSDTERTELHSQLEQAEHNCENGICNWCGIPKTRMEKIRTVLVSDLRRTIYECKECGELTAKYQWNGPQYRAAVATEDGQYHLIAGAKTT